MHNSGILIGNMNPVLSSIFDSLVIFLMCTNTFYWLISPGLFFYRTLLNEKFVCAIETIRKIRWNFIFLIKILPI